MVIVAFLAAAGVGDLWRLLHRPDHKYRLTVEVETPTGPAFGSSVIGVRRHKVAFGNDDGITSISGDAVFVELGGGRNLVALLALGRHAQDPDGMNDLAQRAFAAVHRPGSFHPINQLTGRVPLQGTLIPTLLSFADRDDPASARLVDPDHLEATFGKGYRLNQVTLEDLPAGFWPFDVGGALGQPISRGIEDKLPWLRSSAGGLGHIACESGREACLDARDFQRNY